MSISAGKIAGLIAVSDKYGVIAAVAMDQRSSLKKALGDDVSDEQLVACRSEFITTDAAGGVGVLPLDGPSVGGVGVDIAAELAS